MNDNGPTPSRPESDLYTVLLGIGVLFLLIATVVVSVRSQAFFGTWLPLGGG